MPPMHRTTVTLLPLRIPLHVLNSSLQTETYHRGSSPFYTSTTHPRAVCSHQSFILGFWHCWSHFQKACVTSLYSCAFHVDTFMLSYTKLSSQTRNKEQSAGKKKSSPGLIQFARPTHLDNLDWARLLGSNYLREFCSLCI